MFTWLVSLLLPSALLAAGFAFLFLGTLTWRRLEARHPRTSPLVRNMLRPAGHSLRRRIDHLSVEIDIGVILCLMTPCLFFASHVTQSHYFGAAESTYRQALSSGAAIVMEVFVVYRTMSVAHRRKQLRLAWEGELATAEELNQLMLDGFRVFHDLRFPYGNIDHVVVAGDVVYCVNTKTRGKPREGDDRAGVIVDYQHNSLRFPDGAFPIATDQQRTEVKWLTETLSTAIGEPVSVLPMLALPGWYVTARYGNGDIAVFNPRNPRAYFRRLTESCNWDAKKVEQISHQLDRLCRDIQPTHQGQREWESAPEETLL